MKSLFVFTRLFLISIFILIVSCAKESDNKTSPSSDKKNSEQGDLNSQRPDSNNKKPDLPLQEGCIRGYFGNEYKTFAQHIEKVQPIDSFSNCYFYEDCIGSYADICSGPMKQINLIRSDSSFVIALYIMGVSPDSLPFENPLPAVFCRYAEIQFYKSENWNRVPNDSNCFNYLQDDFYGQKVIITDNKDDVLTGTFGGDLVSPAGKILHVSDGEFKIRILRKSFTCWHNN
jgi:hypothetical protein